MVLYLVFLLHNSSIATQAGQIQMNCFLLFLLSSDDRITRIFIPTLIDNCIAHITKISPIRVHFINGGNTQLSLSLYNIQFAVIHSVQSFTSVNEFRYILCLNQSRGSGRGLVSWLQSSQTFHGLHLLGPSDRHRNRIASGTIQRGVCRLRVLLPRCLHPD